MKNGIFLILLIFSFNIFAQTYTLQNGLLGYTGCKDSYLNDQEDVPFGDTTVLRLHRPRCPSCAEERMIITFSIPTPVLSSYSDTGIENAEFSFYCFYDEQPELPSKGKIYLITKKWNEADVCWSKATKETEWDIPGGDFKEDFVGEIDMGNDGSKKWHTFNVTKTLNELIKMGSINSFYGFIIILEGEEDNLACHSSQAEEVEKRPKLTIKTGITSLTPPIVAKKSSMYLKRTKTNVYLYSHGQSSQPLSIIIRNAFGQKIHAFTTYSKVTQIPTIDLVPGINIIHCRNEYTQMVFPIINIQ